MDRPQATQMYVFNPDEEHSTTPLSNLQASKEELWRVDVSYAESFAEMCKANGVQHISLLGSAGAHENSIFSILRVKAAAEAAVTRQGFGRVSLFRLGMLLTPKPRFSRLEAFLLVRWEGCIDKGCTP